MEGGVYFMQNKDKHFEEVSAATDAFIADPMSPRENVGTVRGKPVQQLDGVDEDEGHAEDALRRRRRTSPFRSRLESTTVATVAQPLHGAPPPWQSPKHSSGNIDKLGNEKTTFQHERQHEQREGQRNDAAVEANVDRREAHFAISLSAPSTEAHSQSKDGAGFERQERKRAMEVHAPEVRAIEPWYGPRTGGVVVLVRGHRFPSQMQLAIGEVPCAETRWLSDEAAHCLVPRGSGTFLPVKILSCSCDDVAVNVTLSQIGKVNNRNVYFSYEEDALAALVQKKLTRLLVLPGRIAIQAHRGSISDDAKELEFRNFRNRGMSERYGIVPHLANVLPRGDLSARHETCALVGQSGSLYGSHLGSIIDSYRAVFRIDNAPSAYRYAADVGKRTTYQVLSNDWAEVSFCACHDHFGPKCSSKIHMIWQRCRPC